MRRRFGSLAILAVFAVTICQDPADAAFYGYTRALKGAAQRIALADPALPPFAFTRFCSQYPQECAAQPIALRRESVKMTAERWAEFAQINDNVNRSIIPERNTKGVAGEEWLINPARGDCNDYAVTKRHKLLAIGWPAHTLLLAEVVIPGGEHHLVLVLRTKDGDFVADNLNDAVRPWRETRYRWVRIQTPDNPNYWATVQRDV